MKQTTNTILMIRPVRFGFNEQTATNNAFQDQTININTSESQKNALQEFDDFVKILREKGINVITIDDTPEPHTPDSIFPNNWVSFHSNGTVITYPMYAENRRTERREDIFEILKEEHHFNIKKKVDFSRYEHKNQFLEGTGSMILDRVHRVVYACLSPRTNADLLEKFCEWADYTSAIFRSVDKNGQDIYHTNVMMCLGETFVVICEDSVRDATERIMLHNKFNASRREVILISYEQMNQFAGNMLQVQNDEGERFLIMSSRAFNSLNEAQVAQIEKHCSIIHSPIPTIETLGGGSVRCMMAEVFLPKK